MTLTARDRVLGMILPGLIVFVIAIFLCVSKSMDLRNTKNAVEATSMEVARSALLPPPDADYTNKMAAVTGKLRAAETEMESIQTQMTILDGQVRDMEKRIESSHGSWRQATLFTRDGLKRNERIKHLNALLARHGISFLEETDGDTVKEGRLSAAMEALGQRIGQGADAQRPHLRRIHCRGRFIEMHNALHELGKGKLLALPVGLTMKTTDDPERREWTLLVWI